MCRGFSESWWARPHHADTSHMCSSWALVTAFKQAEYTCRNWEPSMISIMRLVNNLRAKWSVVPMENLRKVYKTYGLHVTTLVYIIWIKSSFTFVHIEKSILAKWWILTIYTCQITFKPSIVSVSFTVTVDYLGKWNDSLLDWRPVRVWRHLYNVFKLLSGNQCVVWEF